MTGGLRCCGDRGSSVVEVAILTPVVLVLIGFINLTGRIASLQENVQTAAADSARAASLHRSSSGAEAAALDAAQWTLIDAGISCENLAVDVDTSALTPGGEVSVTVRCGVSLTGLSGFPIPGGKTVSVRSVEVIDRHSPGRP